MEGFWVFGLLDWSAVLFDLFWAVDWLVMGLSVGDGGTAFGLELIA